MLFTLRHCRRYSPLTRAAVANRHCTMLLLLNQGVDVHVRDVTHGRCAPREPHGPDTQAGNKLVRVAVLSTAHKEVQPRCA